MAGAAMVRRTTHVSTQLSKQLLEGGVEENHALRTSRWPLRESRWPRSERKPAIRRPREPFMAGWPGSSTPAAPPRARIHARAAAPPGLKVPQANRRTYYLATSCCLVKKGLIYSAAASERPACGGATGGLLHDGLSVMDSRPIHHAQSVNRASIGYNRVHEIQTRS